jgi:hypothetical protein
MLVTRKSKIETGKSNFEFRISSFEFRTVFEKPTAPGRLGDPSAVAELWVVNWLPG